MTDRIEPIVYTVPEVAQIKGLYRKACIVVEKTRDQYQYHAAA